mgnify:CR=1 FL=1
MKPPLDLLRHRETGKWIAVRSQSNYRVDPDLLDQGYQPYAWHSKKSPGGIYLCDIAKREGFTPVMVRLLMAACLAEEASR